ncbi:hypothetical protein [Gracilibacillus thailandensis]|uniref:Uncharacterized protein n=1 Tax=Gracilibacillus thailandensis TaxID=563735 RepID=A0A6N7QVX7_9BACI|nr:hypothetical protein [Gracilibacillus thailandensis]MRI66168.1 hypothetical protein [Gracilibacillus thailandensis]
MTTWIKYTVIGLIFVLAILWVSNIGLRHSTNVSAIQEVQVGTESASIGQLRESATNAFDKRALVANLLLEITRSHKEQGKDIKVDYVFLDESGNVTNNDNEIKSVQFRIQILDDDGTVLSTSTQRTTLTKGD